MFTILHVFQTPLRGRKWILPKNAEYRQITDFTYITGSNILRIFRHGVKLFGGEFLLSR